MSRNKDKAMHDIIKKLTDEIDYSQNTFGIPYTISLCDKIIEQYSHPMEKRIRDAIKKKKIQLEMYDSKHGRKHKKAKVVKHKDHTYHPRSPVEVLLNEES